MKKLSKFIWVTLVSLIGGIFFGSMLQRDEDINPMLKIQDQTADVNLATPPSIHSLSPVPLEFKISVRIIKPTGKHMPREYFTTGSSGNLVASTVGLLIEYLGES